MHVNCGGEREREGKVKNPLYFSKLELMHGGSVEQSK